ncbi:zinc-binding dehydrogenase family protein [Anoxybacillus sp. B7M1]|uniref:zinc-dependent alcohol dehydrogenase family protein n=1 Tax=unclassified Anoxybacillus TaxID=2639704 RepID=UPI0007B57108|nr:MULTISPECIES: zinc-dependent alcohol dehydrogenase family protein [unclassified Anoxybacillus]ANB56957.1 zinc-binding dehydrogenase family protein [Anoxybacillus sp. B2M1]ANB62895.1 zinc-binding dehydrogenase family protein [Anoxybacillus sp. B7M1]
MSVKSKVKTMKAAVYKGPHHLEIQELPYPQPGYGEVTIQVQCCGICGTDYHILEGDFISPFPLVGGHEFSGTIFEIGEGVEGWEIGARVSIDPSIYCGKCYHCRNKQFNHCKNWNAIGVTINGAFAQYVKVPAKNLYKMQDTMTFEEGALVEPMSCVAYALERTNVKFGDKVVIFGGGPMGMMLVQAMSVSGASEVVLVDIADQKLELSKAFGATSAFKNDEHLDQFIGRTQYPNGFDIVVDATGIPAVIEGMFRFAGPGARILQFGVAPNDGKITINPFEVYHKDWSYLGTMALKFNFYQALFMIERKRVHVESLVTKKVNLEEFVEYMSQPKNPEDCKVLVYPTW